MQTVEFVMYIVIWGDFMIKYLKPYLNEIKWKQVVKFVLITPLLGLFLQQIFLRDEVLYHTISELITVLIALLIAVILVSMWKYIQSNPLILIICISVFFSSVVDVFHILAYPGLGYFSSTIEPLNLTLSFWIFARILQAASILFAILVSRYIKKINYYIIIVLFVLVTLFGILFILQGFFPQMYDLSSGLTNTKIINEYIIIFLFSISGYLIVKYQLISNKNIMRISTL